MSAAHKAGRCVLGRFASWLLGLLLIVATVSAAAAPPSGTSINNRARASFTDLATGRGVLLDSNIVSAVVAQIAAFSLTSAQTRSAAPGANVSFQHSVTNLGNGPDSFVLGVLDNHPGTFAFSRVQIFADANSDGLPDTSIPITVTPSLAIGQTFSFVAIAEVPTSASLGQEDRFAVTARSLLGGVPQQVLQNIVTITSNAVVVVTKSFSVNVGPSPLPGLLVTLVYNNIGSSTATNVQITDVIGAANSVPAYNSTGLSYVPGSGRWQTLSVSDAPGGDPPGVTYTASTAAGVTTVRAGIASLPPNTSGQFTFVVDVRAGLPDGVGLTHNAASLSYFDGASAQSSASNNTAVYRVAGAGPDLSLSKTHTGDFTVGTNGVFTLQVRNTGVNSTTAPITVVDTMPASLQIVSSALPAGGAAGWSCNAVGQTVICTNPALVGPGQPHPHPLLLTVTPTVASGNTPIINSATVSGGGELPANAGDNTASDAVNVGLGATVSGRAWYDLNHNRRLDSEPPAAGIIVELRNASNLTVAQTNTDSNGQYLFSNLIPASGYRILFRAPGGSSPLLGRPVNGEQGVAHASSNAALIGGTLQDLTLVAGANVVEQSLPLDPSGVVYDSATRQAVAGATVSLTGPAGFDPSLHLVGGLPNATQVTGVLGVYQFMLQPGAPSGVYSLAVIPPDGYRSGTSVSLPKGGSVGCGIDACLDPTGLAPAGGFYSVQPANINGPPPLGQDTTYYLNFNLDVAVDPNVINNHLPIDPTSVALPGLLVEKVSGRGFAEIGEMIPYTVRVRNAGRGIFSDIEVTDVFPAGFKLVPGSVRLGGLVLPDPISLNGSAYVFRGLGNLPPDTLLTLSYLARIGVAATMGDGINRAQAFSGNTASNVASAKVKINGGVFSDRGIVVGKIYADCNFNRVQDPQELGIPGVRIFLQDGSYVVSDSEGKYSFAGLAARTHVIKVDRTTLPVGSKLATLSNRHALDGGSRFIDLKNGEMQRADFAEFGCSAQTMAQIKARRAKGEVFSIESDRLLAFRLDPEGRPIAPADPRVLPASGVVGVTPGVQTGIPVAPLAPSTVAPSVSVPTVGANAAVAAQPNALPSANTSGFGLFGGEEGRNGAGSPLVSMGAVAKSPVVSSAALELLLNESDNSLAFIDFRDGDTLPFAQTNVRIKGMQGANIQLKINGVEIGADRIGTKSELAKKQVQYREYVGLTLKPGVNELLLIQSDSFGNERARRSIKLVAPDKLGLIKIVTPKQGGIADGRTPVVIEVLLTDHLGVPVTVRTPLTLEASAGRWRVTDQDPTEPGIQTFIVGGQANFELLPPLDPIDASIRVTSGVLKDDKRIPFLPELRPLIGAGVIEGIINARSFNQARLQQARARDGFEQQLNRISRESRDGRTSAAASSAFFLKGKVKGDYLLTMAYDSDKDVRERLFRDIQPNEFYPVYGDSAIRGFDAQSTSHLYLRIDKNKSYLLWGDFTTTTLNPTQRLTQYQRSLTGLKHHYETDLFRVDSFATRDSTRQVIRELPANGTSGPFEFALGDVLVNSEKVELITRDRNQASVIIRSVPLIRFSDYEFEPLTGRLLMRQPVPSVDPFLNPISVRITAEIEQGGETFWVYGVNGQVRVQKGVWLGGTYVRNNNPIPESFSRLTGVNARVEITPRSVLSAELANTLRADGSRGNAERIEWQHESADLRVRAWAGRANAGFDNPASTLNKGREEAGARAEYLLRPGTVLAIEGLHSRDIVSGAAREGVLLSLEQAITDRSKIELGVRRVTEHVVTPLAGAPADTEINSVRLKATSQIPGIAGASAYGEYEQDIKDAQKKLVALGGEYQFASRGKLYARHEFISSLRGAFALNGTQRQNTTVFGIATDYMNNGTLFSEYRGRDSFGQRTTEAAIGLKNFFPLTEGVRLHTGIERIVALSGSTAQESIALTTGLDYTASELWKGTTRLEWRDSQTSQSWLHTAGVAMKVARDWTMLGKHILNKLHTKELSGAVASDRLLQRTQLGLAWRQTDTNRWNALLMFEKKIERDDAITAITERRDVSIVSTHLNYQPTRDWLLHGRYASKWVNESVTGINGNSFAQLLSARVTRDITERWDMSVMSSVLMDRASGSRRRGLGVEFGYLMQANLWLSVGYNIFGYQDRDLAYAEPTERGLFLRLRFKFDEDLFARTPSGGRTSEVATR